MEASKRRPIRSYEDIEAYQRSMTLVAEVHRVVGDLPVHEKYDLAPQMRRAAKSVPANIAEGYARRRSTSEFRRYLTIAMGSANEMEVHLKIAAELGYVASDDAQRLIEGYDIVGRQLNRLISVWRSIQPPASNL